MECHGAVGLGTPQFEKLSKTAAFKLVCLPGGYVDVPIGTCMQVVVRESISNLAFFICIKKKKYSLRAHLLSHSTATSQ